VLATLKFQPFSYLNPDLDPPANTPAVLLADYYFFMVTIDYRTSTPVGHFEGEVNGQFFHGADLLYALGIQQFKADPFFFSASKMASISDEAVETWLSVKTPQKVITIYKPQERAMLLRDMGSALLKWGYKSSLDVLQQSDGYLIREDGTGLLQLLEKFRAYNDPIRKKSYLWIKFVTGRGLFEVKNWDHLAVPVDNHLTRIALRTGIINIQDSEITRRLSAEAPFTLAEDLELREAVRDAFTEIFHGIPLNFRELDDLFWVLGRSHCIHSKNPLCQGYVHNSKCQLMVELKINCQLQCPLSLGCKGFQDPKYRALFEPNIRTYFY